MDKDKNRHPLDKFLEDMFTGNIGITRVSVDDLKDLNETLSKASEEVKQKMREDHFKEVERSLTDVAALSGAFNRFLKAQGIPRSLRHDLVLTFVNSVFGGGR